MAPIIALVRLGYQGYNWCHFGSQKWHQIQPWKISLRLGYQGYNWCHFIAQRKKVAPIISSVSFAQSGDFVFHRPLKTKWQVRNRLDSGSPGGARGSVTRGDSTAYGGPCRPMLPPLGLVEAMRPNDWSGREVCVSGSAPPAP